MQLAFRCPACDQTVIADCSTETDQLDCRACAWHREIPAGSISDEQPTACLVCGCSDLWRQKDFPQRLGLLFVGLGILFSTIAWSRHEPAIAIGILMFFALIDMILYAFMKDMLVCYRCGARHRRTPLSDDHPNFDLEIAERYRQQELRTAATEKEARRQQ